MKLLGGGVAAGAAASGVATAKHRSKGQHLDPLWGHTGIVEDYSGSDDLPDPKDFPPQIRPDHVVELDAGRPFGPHFHQAGIVVEPGDIVMFGLKSPDHAISAYHERLRGESRVPEGVGPFSSPLLPTGGYWLYRFGEEGVYDMFCPPHEFFGMVMRVVAYDGNGMVPDGHGMKEGPSPFHLLNYLKELRLREENLPFNFPSSLMALTSEALSPENIVEGDVVHYKEVFAEFQD